MESLIWKDIDGYEGLYQVSNNGLVRGIRLNIILVQSPIDEKHKYHRVELRKDGKRKSYSVHRLVAQAFVPNPNNYDEVNHIDENKMNNNASNLEWCDRFYNMTHGTIRERISKKSSGCGNPMFGKKHSSESLDKMRKPRNKETYSKYGSIKAFVQECIDNKYTRSTIQRLIDERGISKCGVKAYTKKSMSVYNEEFHKLWEQ